MTSRFRPGITLVLILLTGIPAEAQGNPGTNLSVRLEVVSLNRTGDTSQVSYVAHNSRTSQEWLWALTIEAPAEPFAISKPEPADSWLVMTRYKDRQVVEWSPLTGAMALPGASSPTLSFKAVGLPAIVDAYVEGYYDPPNIDSLPGGDSVLALDALESNSVRLKAVGVEPMDPRATPASLTTRLSSLTDQSCNLRWISSPSVCNSLKRKLQQTGRALGAGDSYSARNSLQSFLGELEAQGDAQGNLSARGNGYWLLKVNGEYILGIIPGGKRTQGSR